LTAGPVEIIAEQSELDRRCAAWREQGWFCFDTEFIRDDTFVAELCLVQVNDGERVVLIDPFEGADLSAFWGLVSDPSITSVIHAGKEDFEVCLRAAGQPPRNVFDVQVAAGFVGYGYPLSLSRLVQIALHKRLDKGQTLTDWARRPLTDDQLHYAVEDVEYLPEIYRKVTGRLERAERAAWAAEEFRRFEDPAFYAPPVEDRLFKLKGSKRLDALGLAVLCELVGWRERWAEARNRPVRALVRDDILVEIAKRRPTAPAQLEVLRGFPQAKNPKIVREVIDLVRRAGQTPRSNWPTPYKPRDDSAMTKVTLDLLSAYLRAACDEAGIDNDLVGGSQKLRAMLDHVAGAPGEAPALLTGWRHEFIGARLVDLLRGKSELHLSGWPDDPHLHVVMHADASAS
jgi:ribonuclease D